jgi:hypothetical protein
MKEKKHLRGSTQEGGKSAFLGYFLIPCVDCYPYVYLALSNSTHHP